MKVFTSIISSQPDISTPTNPLKKDSWGEPNAAPEWGPLLKVDKVDRPGIQVYPSGDRIDTYINFFFAPGRIFPFYANSLTWERVYMIFDKF
jgi:hypothetical protein